MFKTALVCTFAAAAALAPSRPVKTVAKAQAPKLQYQVAAAATAFSAPALALAGGQSEGTGLSLGIDDPRESTAKGGAVLLEAGFERCSPLGGHASSSTRVEAARRGRGLFVRGARLD